MALKASKFAPEDFISIMPDNVVTNILERLPLQDAVMTSILSRNWRKWIKDLTLTHWSGRQVKLPTHLFSCLELKRLKLHNCYLNPPPNFNGFPNLLSLELCRVIFASSDLGEFFTRCPLLEILNVDYLLSKVSLKLAEIAKLENLKVLSLSLGDLDTTTIISSRSIFELVGSLPKLQEFNFGFSRLQEDGAKRRFPTACPCLKTLNLLEVDLGNGIMLSCVFEMIRRFPNLQTLEVTTIRRDADPIPDVEYSTTALRSVVVTYFQGSENEVCLINYILACYPFLKKTVIHPAGFLNPCQHMMLASEVPSSLPRSCSNFSCFNEDMFVSLVGMKVTFGFLPWLASK